MIALLGEPHAATFRLVFLRCAHCLPKVQRKPIGDQSPKRHIVVMSSKWICCLGGNILLVAIALFACSSAKAQLYFTGPYGPGGTWNLYEPRGFIGWPRFSDGGQPETWIDAHRDAVARVEPISGTNKMGHLVSISGPTAAEEDAFIDQVSNGTIWLGLTDNEAFGGGEAGSNGLAGFGNSPGDGIGWKWTSGEVFDYQNWGVNEPRASEFDMDGVQTREANWRTSGNGMPEQTGSMARYIVEYETHSPTPLAISSPMPAKIPGPPPRYGAFGVREVWNNGPIEAVDFAPINTAIQSLQEIGPSAVVRDYYSPVINHHESLGALIPGTDNAKRGRPFELTQRGDVRTESLENFAMVAHGRILIPPGQGGDWTFLVNSDDGFELLIDGAQFKPFPPNAIDAATPYGSMSWPIDRPQIDTLGVISLTEGIHDIELVYFEHRGFASVELLAARGVKTRYDSSFRPIGAPAMNVQGTVPRASDFAARHVQRIGAGPPGAGPLDSLAKAKDLLSNPDQDDRVVQESISRVALGSVGVFGPLGRFGDSTWPLPGDNLAMQATATLRIDTDGIYTFGFGTMDGAEFSIFGGHFSSALGEGAIVNDGQTVAVDAVVGDGITLATIELAAGTYPIEFITYNGTGEAYAELFVAPGAVDFFDGEAFTLLGTSRFPITMNYSRPAGLQLVPEPASVLSAAIGAMIAGLVMWRRRHWRR